MYLDRRAMFHAMNEQRIDNGMTWLQVQAVSGCSRKAIRRLLDESGAPTADFLIRALHWLGKELGEFVISGNESGSNDSNNARGAADLPVLP